MDRYILPNEMRAVLEGLPQPLAVYQFVDNQIITLLVSDGFCGLLGCSDRAQLIRDLDRDTYRNTHPDDRQRIADAALRFATGKDGYDVVYRTRAGVEHDYRVVHARGQMMPTETGAVVACVWYMDEGVYIEGEESSGTKLNRMMNSMLHEESILRAADYDQLTGLPNLACFFRLCDGGKTEVLNAGEQYCLLYMDLNDMKYYNHRYGFAEGDRLLKALSECMARAFGRDNCCHIGADRFAARTVENGLEDRLRQFFDAVRQMPHHLPLRVGIYSTAMEDVPASEAYDRAKTACEILPKSDSSAFRYYTRELSDAEKRHRYIQTHFDRALREKWIQVYYQPIVRAVNGRVCDEEALARWIDPENGFLSPADFIPYLEDAGLIYKLDLYVLDRILESIKAKAAEGYHIVSHSVNLSRSDFDACDIVEEIRRRVDAAGVSRDRISIEITESVIGSDFDFMKTQVERFQALGFPVWMDDFGSGYSSLDLLQSIKFDLLKFDMGFMRRLDESEDGRIILTELMKMASALGVDTICEGVETEAQVRFLQEIGCSKLQGFYFSRPVPLEKNLELHRTHVLGGYENPEESAYYESICGLNLYDLSVIAREEKDSLQNTYTTLPMGIIEIKGDGTRFVRTNQSYRDFFKRFFGLDLSNLGPDFAKYDAAFMYNVVKTCCEQGVRAFYDEKMPDGSVVHSFARRIGVNPITGTTAVAIAVLSIREPNEGLLFEQILSVIEQVGEHMPGGFFIYRADESEELLYANKAVCDIYGCDSLEDFKALTGYTFRGMVHPEDYSRISVSIKDQVARSKADLDFAEYRITRKDGSIRWIDDYGHYIESDDHSGLYYVFISDITDKHDQAESDKALRTAVIEALTKAYDSVWLIDDIATQKFELFRIDPEMEHLMPANIAAKIEKFTQAAAFYSRLVLEEDRQRFLESITPESIVANLKNRLIYSVPFRRVFNDGIRNYRLELVKLDLPDGRTGIVGGFKNVDEEMRRSRQT